MIGAKHNSISNWENDQNRPDPTVLETLCHVLEVTANYLLLGEEDTDPVPAQQISEDEWTVLHKYRRLDFEGRAAIHALLDFANLPQEADASYSTKRSPALELVSGMISSQSAAAGTGTYLDQGFFEPIQLLKNNLTARAAFYVPVAGDSMEPRYHDGDILVVENTAVHRGDIGIFTLDGRGYVKILGDGNLLSLNPGYAPIPMEEDIICNGKVIGTLDPSWIVEN